MERNFYNSDEIKIVLKKLENEKPFFKTAITLLFNTGFRRSELIGLKWEDINFTRNEIRVNKAAVQLDKIYIKKTKTDKSTRRITVPKYCIDLLLEYKHHQKKLGFSVKEEDYIFMSDKGEILSPNYLTHKWRHFLKSNELKKITIHDIRHSHATYLLSLGINIKDVARRLGHSEVSTTYNIYSHSSLIDDINISKSIESDLYKNTEFKKR